MPTSSKLRRQEQQEATFLKWLLDVLDRGRLPKNAYWLDRNARVFAVRWVHAKTQGWSRECADLFRLWKNESSRSWVKDSSEEEETKRMKTNFRMNLRSPNFVELTRNKTKTPKSDEKCKIKVFQVQAPTVDKEGKSNMTGPAKHIRKFRPSQHVEMTTDHTGTNSQDSHLWSNNPTGTTLPPASQRREGGSWNRPQNDKKINWNRTRSELSSLSSSFKLYQPNYDGLQLDDSVEEGLSWNEPNVPCNETNRHLFQYTENSFSSLSQNCTLPDINENYIADYIQQLHTSRYPGYTPPLLPAKQGDMTTYNTANNSLHPTDDYERGVLGYGPMLSPIKQGNIPELPPPKQGDITNYNNPQLADNYQRGISGYTRDLSPVKQGDIRNYNTSNNSSYLMDYHRGGLKNAAVSNEKVSGNTSQSTSRLPNTKGLYDSFVTSPTDSGFAERSSWSSLMSEDENLADCFNDFDPIWDFDSLNDDAVF